MCASGKVVIVTELFVVLGRPSLISACRLAGLWNPQPQFSLHWMPVELMEFRASVDSFPYPWRFVYHGREMRIAYPMHFELESLKARNLGFGGSVALHDIFHE